MPENPKFSSIKWTPTGQVFDIIATDADHATTADSATTATTATNAGHATTADSATTANSANSATTAGTANKLSTKRNIDGIEFDGSTNITHYATCTTAADVAEKVIDCQNFTLDVGSMILVKFNNGNTADISSVKLNVAGTGAKYLYYRGADLPSTFTINSNAVYLFVYHAPRWHLIGDIDTLHDFYASCSTSASTGTKAVTISNFKQQTGSMIVVKFSYTNTADPSSLYLKVNNETAKQIRYKNAILKSAGFIEKDRLYLFTYDGYGWQIVGGFATRTEASSTNGNIVLDGTETTVYTHPSYTSYTGNPTENQTPGFGSTFTVSQVKTDSTGHVSSMTSRTITIPSKTFGGATSSSAGTIGLVPSPVASDRTKYLCGNGKWESLPSASTTASGIVQLSSAVDSNAGYYAATSSAVKQAYDLANSKSTMSFIRSLSSGTKIGRISIDGTSTDIYCEKNTDTWTAMTGATSSANGTVGYVNATPPKDGYNTKYLRADGTWAVPPGVVDHSRRFSTSSNGQDNGWSTIVTADGIAKLQDSATSSLYVTRHIPVGTTAYEPPVWYAAKHSVGLMFANQNQVAIMSMASNNSTPLIKFGATGGGPNGTPVADGTGPANPGAGVGWYFGLTGTTATTYNLDNFLTAHPATSNYSSETTESKEAFSATPVVNTLESFSFDAISSMTRDSFGHVSAEKKTTYTYAPLRRFTYQNTTKNNTWAGIGLESSKYFLSIVRTGWSSVSGQKSPDWAPRNTHAAAIAVSAGNQKAYIGLNSGSSEYPEVAFAAGAIASDASDPSAVEPTWYFKLLGTSASVYTLSNMVESIETTGSGNAITSVALNGVTNAGSKLTFTKGSTFLTEHPNISTSSTAVSTSLYFGNIASNLNTLIKTTFTAASFNGSSTATTVDSNGHVTKLEKTTYTYGPLQCYVYKNATKNNTWNAVGMSSAAYALYIHRYGYSTGTNTNPDWAPTTNHGTGIGISCGDKKGFIGFDSGSSTAPEVSFAAGTCSDGTTTKAPDWYFKLTGTTGVSYDLNAIRTNQAPQKLDEATSSYCIPFFNKKADSVTASEKVYYTTGFCTQYRSGQSSSSPTDATDGCNVLVLGNNTTSGTAGNAFGVVCMYSRLTAPIQLRPNKTSSWINIALPAKSTTSVVMTQIIMYEWSSGTKSDTCTSDAYSSQEFAYFKVFIENGTGSCFCSYDVLYDGSTTLNEFGLVWGKTTTGDGTTKCSTIMITVSKSSNKYTFIATTAPGYQGSTSVTKPTVYIRKVIGVICQKYDP